MGEKLPSTMKKIQVKEITNKFREAVEIVEVDLPKPGPKEILVKNSLAEKGRLIMLGFISGYPTEDGYAPQLTLPMLPLQLLMKSASVRGFYLFHYENDFPKYLEKFTKDVDAGKIRSNVDNGKNSGAGPFKGVESIFDAVEYLYSKKSIGKVVVEFP